MEEVLTMLNYCQLKLKSKLNKQSFIPCLFKVDEIKFK